MLLLDYWLPLAGYENYYEGSFAGYIRTIKTRVLKKYHLNKDGYWAVNVPPKGCKRVHRLICATFLPNPQNKPEVNHLDGDKSNPRCSNLEWDTRKENKEHAMRIGLVKTATPIPDDKVFFIKNNWKTHTGKELSIVTGVSESRIYDIVDAKGNSTEKIIIDINYGIFYEGVTEVSMLFNRKLKEVRRTLSGERPNRTSLRYANWDEIEESMPAPPHRTKKQTPVAKFDRYGNVVERFVDIKNIGENRYRQRVGQFLKGLSSSVDGFYWKLINKDGSFIEPPKFISQKKVRVPTPENATKPKSVIQFDLNGRQIQTFSSIGLAAEYLRVNKRNFKRCITESPTGYYKGLTYKIISS